MKKLNDLVYVKLVFIICIVYWLYLIQHTGMHILCDATGYEEGGQLMASGNWKRYFINVDREPLYSFTIAISMKLAELFNVSYQFIQTVFQILLLFITQLILLKLMRMMKIRLWVQLLAILYVGFSPSLLNAALSLYSEIVAFPFVIAAVYLMFRSWQVIRGVQLGNSLLLGILTGLDFLLIALSKGVYIPVFTLILLLVLVAAVYFYQTKNKLSGHRSVQFICGAAIVFFAGVFSIYCLNKMYNGHFQYTTARFTNALYGSAYKRTQPLTSRVVLAHIASIPGQGVCLRFFSEEECKYCEFFSADRYAQSVLVDKLQNIPIENQDSETKKLIVSQIKENPLQYVLFMVYESLRMFFWESTKIGFVTYPAVLSKLYNWSLFKDGLRLFISLLTMMAFVYTFVLLFKTKRFLFDNTIKGTRLQIGFFAMLLIVAHTFFYSFAFTLTRYALPIASLYLLCIILFIQNKIGKETNA